MRRVAASAVLIILSAAALFLFTSCGKPAEVQWPLPEITVEAELPEDPVFSEPSYPEVFESLDELVSSVDYAILRADPEKPEMQMFSLGEALLERAKEDPEAFVGAVLQSAPIGHNFCRTYRDDALSDGMIGFSGAIDPGFSAG